MRKIKTIAHGIRRRIAGVERRQTKCHFAKFKEADVGMKHFGNARLGIRADDQTRHARAIAELRVGVGRAGFRTAAGPGVQFQPG